MDENHFVHFGLLLTFVGSCHLCIGGNNYAAMQRHVLIAPVERGPRRIACGAKDQDLQRDTESWSQKILEPSGCESYLVIDLMQPGGTALRGFAEQIARGTIMPIRGLCWRLQWTFYHGSRLAGVICLMVSLMTACSAVADEAAGGDFSGVFQGDNLKLNLTAKAGQAGQYEGTVEKAGQSFPCTASVENGQLTGQFEAGEKQFAFTASLNGSTMTFVTGVRGRYTLTRQTSGAAGSSPVPPAATAVPGDLDPRAASALQTLRDVSQPMDAKKQAVKSLQQLGNSTVSAVSEQLAQDIAKLPKDQRDACWQMGDLLVKLGPEAQGAAKWLIADMGARPQGVMPIEVDVVQRLTVYRRARGTPEAPAFDKKALANVLTNVALVNPDAEARQYALDCLDQLGYDAEASVAVFVSRFDDPNADVRKNALRAIELLHWSMSHSIAPVSMDPKVIVPLLANQILKDGDQNGQAAETLHVFSPHEQAMALPTLNAAASSGDTKQREIADATIANTWFHFSVGVSGADPRAVNDASILTVRSKRTKEKVAAFKDLQQMGAAAEGSVSAEMAQTLMILPPADTEDDIALKEGLRKDLVSIGGAAQPAVDWLIKDMTVHPQTASRTEIDILTSLATGKRPAGVQPPNVDMQEFAKLAAILALRGPNPPVRADGERMLSPLGTVAEPGIEILVAAIGDPNSEVRSYACQAIEGLRLANDQKGNTTPVPLNAKTVVPALAACAVKDADANGFGAASEALRMFNAEEQAIASPTLDAASKSGDAKARAVASKLLADPRFHFGGEVVLPQLIASIKSGDGKARDDAFLALANFKSDIKAAIPAVIDALNHPSPKIRAEAAGVVQVNGALFCAAAPKLIQLLDDPDQNVQWEACIALGMIGAPEASPALDRLSKQAASDAPGKALLALRSFGSVARDAVGPIAMKAATSLAATGESNHKDDYNRTLTAIITPDSVAGSFKGDGIALRLNVHNNDEYTGLLTVGANEWKATLSDGNSISPLTLYTANGTTENQITVSGSVDAPVLTIALSGKNYQLKRDPPVQLSIPYLGQSGNVKADAEPAAEKAFFDKDYAGALKQFSTLADAGNATATDWLGYMTESGFGAKADPAAAAPIYLKAAKLGSASAMNHLGFLYETGHGVPQDMRKAMEWYDLSAALGNTASMVEAGLIWQLGKQEKSRPAPDLAFPYYRRAALWGNRDGMADFAQLYLDGQGTGKDPSLAIFWFRAAAERGQVYAMKMLAKMLADGQGAAANPQEARQWFTKAASAGDADAKQWLAQHPG